MKKIIFACIMLALVLTGCGENITGNAVDDTVKLGAILPLTGGAAPYGEAARNALTMAVEEINADGGVRGRKLEIIFEDNKLDASTSLTALNKLVDIDNVVSLVSLSSANTLAMCPVAEAKKVPIMAIATSDAITTRCGDFTFRVTSPDSFQGIKMLETVKEMGVEKIAIAYIMDEYGVGLSETLVEKADEFGIKVVAVESFEVGTKDVKTQLIKIDKENPEAILLVPVLAEGIVFVNQAKQLGIDIPIISGEALKDDSFFEGAGDAVEELYVTFFAENRNEYALNFKSKYDARFGVEASDIFADFFYDMVYIYAQAMEKNGFDSEDIKDALYTVEFDGASGYNKFDENGDVAKPFALFKAENGQFVEQ
ncbi:ABC transporter substrate-binding protein [Candidatus Woesearchaeota archaeon]|nr:ABC transporter substrate-binding protein [Candidatus Woesearchaeota archaeon]